MVKTVRTYRKPRRLKWFHFFQVSHAGIIIYTSKLLNIYCELCSLLQNSMKYIFFSFKAWKYEKNKKKNLSSYDIKNYAGFGGCYLLQPSASEDNTLLDLHNPLYHTQLHPIIVKYFQLTISCQFTVWPTKHRSQPSHRRHCRQRHEQLQWCKG